MPPLDLQMLLGSLNGALARQAASNEKLCICMQMCEQINQMNFHICLMSFAGWTDLTWPTKTIAK